MKSELITLLSLITTLALSHEGVELGPNKGRILEFSKNESLHGELTVKGDRFHVALLDKDMKPVAISEQTLTATTGERDNPIKLTVEKNAKGFTLPAVEPGAWLILQFKDQPKSKPVTARMEYNTSECEACKKAEWLCECKPENPKK